MPILDRDACTGRAPPSHWHTDWRRGTTGAIGTVYGSAADHAELSALLEQLRERLYHFWHGTHVPQSDMPQSDMPHTGVPQAIGTVGQLD
ncbi:hypothetical protein [Streptomyces sp. NPDC048516]|uniref:hypothetical protein n=1 Tax=Streptomyces sp. NPDC048516 TaxID=3365565 RepID=UPI00371861CB